MYFLIDHKNLIIFGWSAKCGCTHLKAMFHFLKTNEIKKYELHNLTACGVLKKKILKSIGKYTTIIVSRNPYERLVSGFLDKYKIDGAFRYKWPSKNIKFSDFVNKLGNEKYVENHHFTPQTSESFDEKILESKIIKCYDIKNIDYEFIGKLYNKKIPKEIIDFRGDHSRKSKNKDFDNRYLYDLNMEDYFDSKVKYKYFYNDHIKQQVFNFYKKDFTFFKKFGIDYTNFEN